MYILPETELVKINQIKSEKSDQETFVLEPLLPGYGMTLGNALRRVLLSSLNGSAISSVKINGINHEFSTIPGVKEDVVKIILNLKGLRIKSHSDEPTTLRLIKKGAGKALAKDFTKNAMVEIIDPNFVIATLDKSAKLDMEVTIEKGRGYVPTERRKEEKLPLGTIAIDSIFTPIKKIYYNVVNTRVGGMTNFDKLTITITTDGSITPKNALILANKILLEHFGVVDQFLDTKSKAPALKTSKSKTALAEKQAVSKVKADKKTAKVKKAK